MIVPKNTEIVMYPNDVLSRSCEDVMFTDETGDQARTLIEALGATVGSDRDAYALAAPQIGISRRMFAIRTELLRHCMVWTCDKAPYLFINPTCYVEGDYKSVAESCMSLPSVEINVHRAARATVTALDIHGKPFEVKCHGIAAQVMQHEMDHLAGMTLLDRATPKQRRQLIREWVDSRKRKRK